MICTLLLFTDDKLSLRVFTLWIFTDASVLSYLLLILSSSYSGSSQMTSPDLFLKLGSSHSGSSQMKSPDLFLNYPRLFTRRLFTHDTSSLIFPLIARGSSQMTRSHFFCDCWKLLKHGDDWSRLSTSYTRIRRVRVCDVVTLGHGPHSEIGAARPVLS